SFGEVSTGAHDDRGKATAIVREMVTRFGMSRRLGLATLTRTVGAPMLGIVQEERLMSEQTAREVDEEVRERVTELYRRAKQILAERRAGLEAAAEALLQRETLTGDELGAIADAAVIREKNEKAKAVDAA
ncbi:MAG TPA: cell division protein FtsH, partial [Minicystis sp.]|nr:cell division protein FtsH [Minicystis sp.]